MNFFERHKIAIRKSTQEKIREAGDAMAKSILKQLHEGKSSPFKVEIENPAKHLSDEMFLLRSTTRAVQYLGSQKEAVGLELPLYDEHSTILANHESEAKELVVIFARPSELVDSGVLVQ